MTKYYEINGSTAHEAEKEKKRRNVMSFLPRLFVYAFFKDGRCYHIANVRTLTKEEAQEYKEKWDKSIKAKGHGQVVRINLQDIKGKIYETYSF